MSVIQMTLSLGDEVARVADIFFTSKKSLESGNWGWRTEDQGWVWEHTMVRYQIVPPLAEVSPALDESIRHWFLVSQDDCSKIADEEAAACS